jgi:twitching motility protein PilT
MYTTSELELNKLLGTVLARGASDLHLVSGEPPIIRFDGSLIKLDENEVLTSDAIAGMVDAMLSPAQRDLFKTRQDVDFSYTYKGSARFRINAYYQKGQVSAAFRLIPAAIKTLQELNLPEALLKFADQKQGLVLVVGPTGHGKSTAQACLINHVNQTRAEHILTIEDPIEFVYTPDKSIINQREIDVDTPSFAQALKSALREDINVVLVGEMRDVESTQAVMTIAETGHLVFATLHTNDAAQTVDRIVDMFPPTQQQQVRAQLSNVLIGIVSMRLLPVVGGGRVPAVEILQTNSAVRNVIREGKTFELNNIIQTSMADGMVALDRSLAELVQSGRVNFEDARAYVKDPDYFGSLVVKRSVV